MVAASVRMSTVTINNTENTIQPQLTITIHITSNTTLNMHINTRYGSHGAPSSLLLLGPRLRRLRVANTALWPPRMAWPGCCEFEEELPSRGLDCGALATVAVLPTPARGLLVPDRRRLVGDRLTRTNDRFPGAASPFIFVVGRKKLHRLPSTSNEGGRGG